MAKGNPFWAKQQGKLGETVLAVVNGQQIQRAYNPEPANPRTNNQTAQRIIFSSAVKLFKSAIAKQFKFAYEDKKLTESDYNAFMRHNIKNGMVIERGQYLNQNFPSIGEFLLSFGSLPEIRNTEGQGTNTVKFNYGIEIQDTPTTLQGVASWFRAGGHVLDGDIITLLHIRTAAANIDSKPTTAPSWNVVQIMVGDAIDHRTIASVSSLVNVTSTESDLIINLSENNAEGCALIISRPTPGGLKVSNSRIWYNGAADSILTASKQNAYIEKAKLSWGMGTQAVLEGSLLPK